MSSNHPTPVPRCTVDDGKDPPRTSARRIASLRCDVSWRSDAVDHCDSLFLAHVDLWRDDLPSPIKEGLKGRAVGHREEFGFAPGQLLEGHRLERVLTLSADRFNRRLLGRGRLEPRLGRFYPKAILLDVEDLDTSDRRPLRIVATDAQTFTADSNHPLAGKALEVAVTVDDILGVDPRRAGPGLQIRSRLLDNGPGMQGRWQGRATDFFADEPFARPDSDDTGFYARARLVDHLDSTAICQISALYGRLIPPGSRILDLMSSWHSHLPQALRPDALVGLGMNAEELAQNPVLTERVVHDLNANPGLPFDDESFEAVVCTVSVEYLTQPFAIFRELARVLTPGGIAVVTFSNRWFPTKAIRIWEQLHEFERPGLVLEYFRDSGHFRDFNTWSLRGLPRPALDKYARSIEHADPVHAVWARRDADGS